MHEHVHEPNILQKTVRTEEKRMIAAAALVVEFLLQRCYQKSRQTWSGQITWRPSPARGRAGHSPWLSTGRKRRSGAMTVLSQRLQATSSKTSRKVPEYLHWSPLPLGGGYMYYVDGKKSKLFFILKGQSHEIFTLLFFHRWIDPGQESGRYWF